MKRDWLSDLLHGGAWSWNDGEPERSHVLGALVIVALLLTLLVAGAALLANAQARGEAPQYTCNPENHPYTTRECAP